MIISKITINELREVDSINLIINNKLVDYISMEEGVSIEEIVKLNYSIYIVEN